MTDQLQIIKDFEAGLTIEQIAIKHKLSQSWVYQLLRDRLGTKRTTLKTEIIDLLMHTKLTNQEIAQRVGSAGRTIAYYRHMLDRLRECNQKKAKRPPSAEQKAVLDDKLKSMLDY